MKRKMDEINEEFVKILKKNNDSENFSSKIPLLLKDNETNIKILQELIAKNDLHTKKQLEFEDKLQNEIKQREIQAKNYLNKIDSNVEVKGKKLDSSMIDEIKAIMEDNLNKFITLDKKNEFEKNAMNDRLDKIDTELNLLKYPLENQINILEKEKYSLSEELIRTQNQVRNFNPLNYMSKMNNMGYMNNANNITKSVICSKNLSIALDNLKNFNNFNNFNNSKDVNGINKAQNYDTYINAVNNSNFNFRINKSNDPINLSQNFVNLTERQKKSNIIKKKHSIYIDDNLLLSSKINLNLEKKQKQKQNQKEKEKQNPFSHSKTFDKSFDERNNGINSSFFQTRRKLNSIFFPKSTNHFSSHSKHSKNFYDNYDHYDNNNPELLKKPEEGFHIVSKIKINPELKT